MPITFRSSSVHSAEDFAYDFMRIGSITPRHSIDSRREQIFGSEIVNVFSKEGESVLRCGGPERQQ